MGSFSEVVLGFEFREDTPSEVLASVARLARPLPDDAWWGPAPALPAPVEETSEFWTPDWRESGLQDEFAAEPWRHDWAPWLSGSMSVTTVPSAQLVWGEVGRWSLTCRCSFKAWPEATLTFLEWLGPYMDTRGTDQPRFVGYIAYDGAGRPYLLWADSGRLKMEDLNPPGTVG